MKNFAPTWAPAANPASPDKHRWRSQRRPALIALAAAPLALLAAPGCGPGGPITDRLQPDVKRPQPGIVLFICDGVGADTIEQGCREGWLPNIQKRFVAGGTCVANATTAIPAITYGVIATFLTGTGPGTHAIVGNRWFDPDRSFFRNYVTIEDYRDIDLDCTMPTLYQLIQPMTSVNIQTAQARGVTYDIPNWMTSGVFWFAGNYPGVDQLTADTLSEVAWWANGQKQWPVMLTCYFPGADTVAHRLGPGSPQYRQAVMHLDHQVGRICDWLESQGLLETTDLVLVSDHGMCDVRPDGFTDLMHLVRDRWGRHATDYTLQEGSESSRRAYFDRFDTVVAYQNGRCAFIYLRSPTGWCQPAAPAEVEVILNSPPPELQLWNLPAADLVSYLADDNAAVIRSQRGVARILRRAGSKGPEYAYQPEPDDVLGYLDDPNLAAFVHAGFHAARDWLRATAEQPLPDVVPHLVPLLHNHHAGQAIVFAKPGYSFVHELGGHGGIRRTEMRIPFVLAGPGIKPGGKIEIARSVDLAPTLLDLLGLDPHKFEWLEGTSLLRTSAELPPAASASTQP
jgi:hypothetical protein